ncbi:MAG: FAD-binding monooxygenase, partial [Ramlibacter sp.]
PYTRSGACDATGGQSVQNVSFHWPDGSGGTVNELLRWADGRLLLLVFGDLSPIVVKRLQALAAIAPLCCVQVAGPQDGATATEHVRDPTGDLRGACHVSRRAWALVRPDSYVAATGENIDATLIHAVRQALGATVEPA